jgi:flagellar hook-associated protein 1 FlgK
MSLWGTLNVGKTALATNQLALQTVGNNIANVGNENYTRQVVRQGPNKPQEIRPGLFVGTGVNVDNIERMIDESVEQRLRAATGDAEGSQAASQWLTRVESVYNELSDEDLSTNMSTFFNSWSELANKPQDVGLRQVVVQNGDNLAQQLKTMRSQFDALRNDLNDRITGYVNDADTLASKIADINVQISRAEGGNGTANTLRDQRDMLLKDLSKLMNFNTAPGDNGMVNVFVGSEPLVLGDTSRGITTRTETDAETGDITKTLVFKDSDGVVPVTSGILGGTKQTLETIRDSVHGIDDLASNLIFELNKIHSSGQGLVGFNSVSSSNLVTDPDASLTSDDADLDFMPKNGSFVVHVKDKATGAMTSTLIQVDLDGNGTDTTLNTLAASLDGVDNVSASVSAGRLTINSDSSAVELSFSQDSSGTLAALGIGGFYSGSDARDIAVRDDVKADPRLLAAARNGQPADNQTAKLIAALQEAPIGALNNQSLKDAYQSEVNGIASQVQGAKQDADAAAVVTETLAAQRDAVSGVSLDEEAINLMRYQRAYQAASRVISATDEMIQTLLSMV